MTDRATSIDGRGSEALVLTGEPGPCSGLAGGRQPCSRAQAAHYELAAPKRAPPLSLAAVPTPAQLHRVLSFSAGAAALLGTSAEALRGSDLRAVLNPSNDGAAVEALDELERQVAARREGSARLKLGRRGTGGAADARWLGVSMSALPGGQYAWALERSDSPAATAPLPTPPQQQRRPSSEEEQAAAGAALGPPLSAVELAALRALPQPVWVCDADGRTLFVNPAFCAAAGCAPDAAPGRPWAQLLLPTGPGGDDAAAQRLGMAVAAGQAAQERVLTRCATSGSRQLRWAQVTVTPLAADAYAAGRPVAVCTLLANPAPSSSGTPGGDPSLRAAAAASGSSAAAPLPGLAQLCNQALASTSESVVIMDATQPGNPICYANQAFERLTGEWGVKSESLRVESEERFQSSGVVRSQFCSFLAAPARSQGLGRPRVPHSQLASALRRQVAVEQPLQPLSSSGHHRSRGLGRVCAAAGTPAGRRAADLPHRRRPLLPSSLVPAGYSQAAVLGRRHSFLQGAR